jgi:oligopeptide transport system ATP-binding protein
MAPLLDVKQLEVAFYTKDGVVRAVNGISYSLEKGDTLGIVGESGSGKSVSLLAMLGLIPMPPGKIMGGEVLFDGKDLLKLRSNQWSGIRGKQIAMIFQDPMTSLNPVMTIGDQIDEATTINLGLGAKEARQRTVEVLSMVGIPRAAERCKDFPHQFSGGMRQRVMIAMGISCRPQLLIADEPTTALDVTIQAQIIDLVKRLQREMGMTVIWVTHDLGVVARLTRRIIVMYGGSIMENGPVKTIYSHPSHPYTIGLLASVPGASVDRNTELHYIAGSPPDMIRLPKGCPFAPRCIYVTEQCRLENPPLREISADQKAACWNLDGVAREQISGRPVRAGGIS